VVVVSSLRRYRRCRRRPEDHYEVLVLSPRQCRRRRSGRRSGRRSRRPEVED
jgi:hypothetical protein